MSRERRSETVGVCELRTNAEIIAPVPPVIKLAGELCSGLSAGKVCQVANIELLCQRGLELGLWRSSLMTAIKDWTKKILM